VSWHDRRYSEWLLKHEEALEQRQGGLSRLIIAAALTLGTLESLLPWEHLTPSIPVIVHIAAAALLLPFLYFANQADFRRKLQAFSVAMSDRGLRFLFLDPYFEPEEYELQERVQGAHLLPLQRVMDSALKSGASQSLHHRLSFFYRALPSPVCEGDRLGALSVLHPTTALSWGVALAVAYLALPYTGLKLYGCSGFTTLPLMLLLYLFSARANSRFAFETALYNWLRLG
jgi:hypothetical protein